MPWLVKTKSSGANMCSTQKNMGAAVGLQHERARFITPKKYLTDTTNYYQRNDNKSKGLFLAKYPRLRNTKMSIYCSCLAITALTYMCSRELFDQKN